MATIRIQKCNGCQLTNEKNDPAWARVMLIQTGNLSLPAFNRGMLDFCPACQIKTSVSQALAMLGQQPKPVKPIAGPAVVTGPGQTAGPK